MGETGIRPLDRIDHLVYAVPDLRVGVAAVEDLFDMSAQQGGRHPAFGTANALIGLGNKTYLEIVGPDPEGQTTDRPSIFLIDELDGPRLVTWAAKTTRLEEQSQRSAIPAVLGATSRGTRTRSDGTTVTWQLTDPYMDRLGGVIPFLIDWGTGIHPTESLDQPCRLISLDLFHPEPSVAQRWLDQLGVQGDVGRSPDPALVATIETPEGVVRLS